MASSIDRRLFWRILEKLTELKKSKSIKDSPCKYILHKMSQLPYYITILHDNKPHRVEIDFNMRVRANLPFLSHAKKRELEDMVSQEIHARALLTHELANALKTKIADNILTENGIDYSFDLFVFLIRNLINTVLMVKPEIIADFAEKKKALEANQANTNTVNTNTVSTTTTTTTTTATTDAPLITSRIDNVLLESSMKSLLEPVAEVVNEPEEHTS